MVLENRRKTLPFAVLLFFLPVMLTGCSMEEEATEALAALEAEYDAAQEALSESQDSLPEMSEDPDSAEMAAFRALLDERSAQYEDLTNTYRPRYEALAEEFWGTGAGLEAKIWALSRAERPDMDADEEEREAAREAREANIAEETEAIFEEYAESPHIEQLAENSYLFSEEQAEDYLGRLRENSPHPNVRAAAIYYPANRKLSMLRFERMREDFGLIEGVHSGEEGAEGEEESHAEEGEAEEEGHAEESEGVEEAPTEEAADPRAEIEADLQLIIDEYGDIPMGGSTYGAVAYAHLTSHTDEELAVGAPAPEIIGANVDGEEMRLSDFKGKVTVFYFWGDW